MADTKALLLDFDGPVCSVFAGIPAHMVASQLRAVLAEGGNSNLPSDVEKSEDPFETLFYAATLGRNEAHVVEAALRAHEVEAIMTATPTRGAHELIRTWPSTDRSLAIVSNNSIEAIEIYLELHGLSPFVDAISARADANPLFLKPQPFLVTEACTFLQVSPVKCTLVGDSVTDVQAGRAAGVKVVGYANKPGKEDLFKEVGVDATILQMSELLLQVP
jgi:HAD superfamily hydrolase (TIGR01549 family)